MHHFFADPSCIRGNKIYLTGGDVSHMKNVLRMRAGEDVTVGDNEGNTYLCCLETFEAGTAVLDILKKQENDTELPACICSRDFLKGTRWSGSYKKRWNWVCMKSFLWRQNEVL